MVTADRRIFFVRTQSRTCRKPEAAIVLPRRGIEAAVGLVEKQEVFSFDVEDDGLGVGRFGPQHSGVEHRVEQEGGVAGLGRHP